MPNTYQDLITEIQSKNPEIHQKLEGGQKFKLTTEFKPAGDQPEAIKQLVKGANKDELNQVLLGAQARVGPQEEIQHARSGDMCAPNIHGGKR